MRLNPRAPLVDLPTGAKCCDGVITLGADELPLMQQTIVGTRAWHAAYGRRNRVEAFNAFLHGMFVDIDKGYVHIIEKEGRGGRIAVLLAHTLAGANRWYLKNQARIEKLLAERDDIAAPPTGSGAPRGGRKPRSDRAKRYEDLTTLATDP